MYYNTTPLSGAPSAFTTLNGWNLVASGSISAVANTTTTVTQTFLSGLNFIIPANTTYGIVVFGTSQRYFSITATGTTTISASGLNLLTGTNIGYGGNTPPTAPTIAQRGWIGEIVFNPALPCSGNPTAGNAITSANYACSNQPFNLSLANDSIRTGLTYQWLKSTTGANGTYSILPTDTSRTVRDSQTVTSWYRCLVSCGTSFSTDTSTAVMVKTSFGAISGVVTINSNLPLSATNFASLADFATEIACIGVSGPLIVNVDTFVSTQNIEFGAIPGVNSFNTVTINGKNKTITSDISPILRFNGTKYVIIDSLKIIGNNTTFSGFGIQITGQSQYLTIKNSVINVGTTSTATTNAGIAISNSTTSAITAGNNAQYLTINNNTIIGGYYGITALGDAGYLYNSGHSITNNTITDFYFYGMYLANADSCLILKNDVNRLTRTTLSTFYAIYMGTCRNINVRNNKFHDAGTGTYTAYPIYLVNCVSTVGFENMFVNNLIYNINTTGTFYGIYSLTTALTGAKFLHNTINHDVQSSTGAIRGAFFSVATTNVIFRNNIITIKGSGTGIKAGIYLTTASTGFTSNNNVLFNNATGGTNLIGYWAANQVTLANWRTASGQDLNSVSANPVFANVNGGLLTPISINVDNVGSPQGILTDLNENTRSTTTPDAGALEFTGINGDISINKIELVKSSVCYSSSDTIKITIQNLIGSTIDFSVNPLTIVWQESGRINKTDSFIINTDTLGATLTKVFYATNFDMSAAGFYNAKAYISLSTINAIFLNDTLSLPSLFEVKPILSVLPKTRLVTSSLDTVSMEAFSPLFPSGGVYFSEIAHYKVATGAPSAGWPSYLLADDYVELTGVPNSSLAGFTMEEWTGTTMQHTVTFPTGIVFSPNGTMILATGQLTGSVPSPSNFYYHTGNTVTHSSTGDYRGYIIKNPSGVIVDATVYGTYTFPTISGVTSANWTGITPNISSSGNRLNAPRNFTASSWVNSGVTPQNPNALNGGLTVPVPGSMAGFEWSYLGTPIDTNAKTKVGPYTIPGVRLYIATYTNTCGVFSDTVIVTATSTVPVKMLTFKGEKVVNDVILNWETASEINNSHFDVQYSINGKDFITIGKVNGKINTTVKSNYTFNHANAILLNAKINTIYYRLAQNDLDGKITMSNIIKIITNDDEMDYIKVIPNPNNGNFVIATESENNLNNSLKIINNLGKTVWQIQPSNFTNTKNINIDISLPNGIYYLQMEDNNGLSRKKILINK